MTNPVARLLLAVASVLLMCFCSCAHTNVAQNEDPFLPPDASAAESVASDPADTLEQFAAATPPAGHGRVHLGNVGIRPVTWQQPVFTADENPTCPPDAIIACPPDARLPGQSGWMGAGPVEDCNASSPLEYPDEYLFDGGDRQHPVHYDEYHLLGLDTEDTIAEFEDDEGLPGVKHSTRVAIYAPRFGSVTTISSPSADTSFNKVAGAFTTAGGNSLKGRTSPNLHAQREGTERIRTRSRASGIDTDAAQSALDHTTRTTLVAESLNLFQSLGLQKGGQFDQSDEARLAIQIQSAEVWTRTEFPVVIAVDKSSGEATTLSSAAEFVGREPQAKRKGKLVVIKTADVADARPGDIVTFTIRYKNIGERPLYNIVVHDNLTPRLEYVPDSATSDRAGALETDDNGEGSLVLRWVLDEPLPGKAEGVVTFKTRIR